MPESESIQPPALHVEPENALTAADFLDNGGLIRIDIPAEIMRNGKPGVVYMRLPKTREVLALTFSKDEDRPARLVDNVGRSLCTADGTSLFPTAESRKRLAEGRSDLYLRVQKVYSKHVNPDDDEDKADTEGENPNPPGPSNGSDDSATDGPNTVFSPTDSD